MHRSLAWVLETPLSHSPSSLQTPWPRQLQALPPVRATVGKSSMEPYTPQGLQLYLFCYPVLS